MTSRNAGEGLLRILDGLDELISNVRSISISASAIVDRENILHLVDQARDTVSSAAHRTEKIVADADTVLAKGRAEPERLVQYVQGESEWLVAGENIACMANDWAGSIVAAAEDKAASLRHGADKYSGHILASLGVEVVKVAEQIRAGREVLAGRLGDGAGQPVEIQESVRHRSGQSVGPSAH